MRTIFITLFIITLVLSCSCTNIDNWQGTNLDYKELVTRYNPVFFGEAKTLTVEINNPGGLNIVSITKMSYNGNLYLGGIRNSSGGKHTSKFHIDISQLNLGNDWMDCVYWWNDLSKKPENYNHDSIPDNVRTKITVKSSPDR